MKSPRVDEAVITLALKIAMEKEGIPTPPAPAPGQPALPAEGPALQGEGPAPQGFIPLPGGPQEQASTLQGMTQTPGAGMARAIPSG